jgi:hypothetical protein
MKLAQKIWITLFSISMGLNLGALVWSSHLHSFSAVFYSAVGLCIAFGAMIIQVLNCLNA